MITNKLCSYYDNINKFCAFLPHHYSFTRVQFALLRQENQDANLGEDNYIFFLSGSETGKAVCVCVCVCARVCVRACVCSVDMCI